MSSSPRSSRSRKPKTAPCPTCGSRRVLRVTEDIVLRVGGNRYKVEAVPHERCSRCGERVFGIDASHRFDAVVLSRRRHVA